ncbi:MAG: DUF3987 domain-containing protein, partial [Bacteroidales bacterium]|nr:DUF3987 domain-containing protein [Candidatus Colimorpha onthohippi]
QTEQPIVAELIAKFRAGDAEAKKNLPAINFMGVSTTGKRRSEFMQPTGLVMIDIDHCDNPREAFNKVSEALFQHMRILKQAETNPEPCLLEPLLLLLAYVTPSGKGLRLVFRNINRPSVSDNIKQISTWLGLGELGDVDECCKDLTRISFLCQRADLLFICDELFVDCPVYITASSPEEAAQAVNTDRRESAQKVIFQQEEFEEVADLRYNGFLIKDIIDKYLAKSWDNESHTPPEGKRHMFYNQMVRDFRNLVDNNPRTLALILPTFGRPMDECYSQCKSITRQNSTSMLPKQFYFFLRDNGYYIKESERKPVSSALTDDKDPFAELNELIDAMPKLPPVFREFVNAAPRNFKIPTIMGLLPVMGTLSSYLSAEYMDGELMTTSFISIIYAPASHGKSFIRKFWPALTADMKNRDLISAAKEQMYSDLINRKGSNDKAPADPHVTCRIMPAINSLPEVLQKMRNNGGYHMLTLCEEMDTWNKGSKSQGGDKNDLYRIAWDNGEYGQAFKSTGTFKGIVNLYWNVLITGTPKSVKRYFKDVENGLITRCSFSDLGDQAFAKYVPWKKLSKRDQEIIQRFMARCDSNTYTEPLTFDMNKIYDVTSEDFDKTVPWQFQFRQRQQVDVEWIFPTLCEWLDKQAKKAEDGYDNARDTFRRRVAVRGFRLALLCHALWSNIGKPEKKIIEDFVKWYLDVDMYQILKLFGKEYNDVMAENSVESYEWSSLYEQLGDEFEMTDLITLVRKMDVKTPPRIIIHTWRKNKRLQQGKVNEKYIKIKK